MPDDFLGFLPPDKATAAFHYIDDNDSGRVAQSELLNVVVQIFRWGFWGLGSERQAPKACCSKPYTLKPWFKCRQAGAL